MRDILVYADNSIYSWLYSVRDRLRPLPTRGAEDLVRSMPNDFIGLGRQRGSFRLLDFRFEIETQAMEAGSYVGRGSSYFTIYRGAGAAFEHAYDFSLTIDPETYAVHCEQPELVETLGYRIPIFTGRISRDLKWLILQAKSDPPGTNFIFKLYALPPD